MSLTLMRAFCMFSFCQVFFCSHQQSSDHCKYFDEEIRIQNNCSNPAECGKFILTNVFVLIMWIYICKFSKCNWITHFLVNAKKVILPFLIWLQITADILCSIGCFITLIINCSKTAISNQRIKVTITQKPID